MAMFAVFHLSKACSSVLVAASPEEAKLKILIRPERRNLRVLVIVLRVLIYDTCISRQSHHGRACPKSGHVPRIVKGMSPERTCPKNVKGHVDAASTAAHVHLPFV